MAHDRAGQVVRILTTTASIFQRDVVDLDTLDFLNKHLPLTPNGGSASADSSLSFQFDLQERLYAGTQEESRAEALLTRPSPHTPHAPPRVRQQSPRSARGEAFLRTNLKQKPMPAPFLQFEACIFSKGTLLWH